LSELSGWLRRERCTTEEGFDFGWLCSDGSTIDMSSANGGSVRTGWQRGAWRSSSSGVLV